MPCSNKRIIVLNKVDLADRTLTDKWVKYFGEKNYICCGVNSHNKDSIKALLSFVRARIRKLKGTDGDYTATVLVTGIPNMGKSAITNSMHQIGRISAAEKGKLKHVIVSPQPGETRHISSYKIASHPNIYMLDTPGVLYPEIIDDDFCSKLALIGTVKDTLLGEYKVAQYFLLVLNSMEQYKDWENLKDVVSKRSSSATEEKCLVNPKQKRRELSSSDHTQDYIVRDVRQTLFKTISSFEGYSDNEETMEKLIEAQFVALRAAFRLSLSADDGDKVVACKLLNLYRTGRLGQYTLDLPSNIE